MKKKFAQHFVNGNIEIKKFNSHFGELHSRKNTPDQIMHVYLRFEVLLVNNI